MSIGIEIDNIILFYWRMKTDEYCQSS